jgi:hypothetical protein
MDQIESVLGMKIFRGVLKSPDGTPVPDGAYDINLNIFSEPFGGKAIWSQTMKSIKVLNGNFQIPVENKVLPSADVYKGDTYLEVQVGEQAAEIRQKLEDTNSTNYAPVTPNPGAASDVIFSFRSNLAPDPSIPPGGHTLYSSTSVVGRLPLGPRPHGIAVSNGYVYVTTVDDRGFHVIDAHDPTFLTVIGTLTFPAYGNRSRGAMRVVLSGDYAYVLDIGNNPVVGGLLVVDVRKPTNPVLVGNVDFSNIAFDLGVSGDRAVVAGTAGLDVFALEKGSNPVWSNLFVSGGSIAGVVMVGNFAYVVHSGFGPPDNGSLFHIIDVSEPTQPIIIGTTSLAYGTQLSYGALYVCVSDRYAYITGAAQNGWVVDIGNPARPVVIGDWSPAGIPRGVWLSGNNLYTIDDTIDLYQVFDIRAPNHPVPIYSLTVQDVHSGYLRGVVANDYAYVVSPNHDLLRIIRLAQ